MLRALDKEGIMDKACFRKLHPYKYQLMKLYIQATDIKSFKLDKAHLKDYLKLTDDGKLEIKKGYAWDGPSGPTIDTLNFMRGSLVHDALYQLIREKAIPYSFKDYTDQLLKKICREDGMSRFRAWYVYQAVKWFGHKGAKPGSGKPDKIICAP